MAFKAKVTLGIALQPADGKSMEVKTWKLRQARPAKGTHEPAPDLMGEINYGLIYLQRRLGSMTLLELRRRRNEVGCSAGSVCHTWSPADVITPNTLEFLLPHSFSYAHLCIFNGLLYKLHISQGVLQASFFVN